MKWRVIGPKTHDAYFNMALDQAVSERIMDGTSPPTIRFYTWNPRAVSISYFQSLRDEVNLEICRELGIDCVWRWTGGGAVYHDTDGKITYSMVTHASLFSKNIQESYKVICGWIVEGLRSLCIDAVFNPLNDILVDRKKISGSAQTRKGGILLQHGTVLYSLDLKTMFSVLNVSKPKITDKMIQNAEDRVTCISKHANVDKNNVYQAQVRAFTEGKDSGSGILSNNEIARAEEFGGIEIQD